MFWALAAGRIGTGDRRYVHELGDIESLNRRALAGELEVTAVSLHAYAYLADRYALLAHGASIGDRYGPRIVARAARPTDPRAALAAGSLRIAVPGELTTAYLALKLYQPAARHAEALAHATAYSRGLDPTRIDRFVGMYVNAYTVDYGPTGRQAVAELLARAHGAGLLPGPVKVTFVTG